MPASPRWLPPAALLLGALVFLPMFGHPFFRDDLGWVERARAALPRPAQWWAIAKTDFRPLASLSFVVNYAAVKLDPRGYHLFDLLLHLVDVSLLMALVRRLSGSGWAAGVAGLVFACALGNYGEAVYWISGRTGPLADAFVLGALIAHWDRLEGTGPSGSALFLFTVALFAKETAVVLLPLLVLLEWAHGRVSWRRVAPFALLALAYVAFVFLVWRAGSGVVGGEFSFGWHVGRNLVEYIVRMFVPVARLTAGAALPAGAACAALFAWLLTRRIPRTWKFALLWIPVAILPVAFLDLRTSTRYLYLPSMGLAALIGLAWARAWAEAPLRRRLLACGLALVLAVQVVVMQVVLARRGELARREAGLASRQATGPR
jgi:hypothetical protein